MDLAKFDNLSNEGLSALVEGMINRMDVMEGRVGTIHEDKKWYLNLVSLIKFSVRVKKSFSIIEAYAFTVLKDNWDSIPMEFRLQFNNNFYEMVFKLTELSIGTIDNYVSAARAFKQLEVNRTVEIPVRDQAGKPVYDGGVMVTKEIEWDVTIPGISKLVACSTLARDGSLARNDEVLSLLMDDGATVDDVRNAVSKNGVEGGGTKTFTFQLYGGLIVAKKGEERLEVAEIDHTALRTEEGQAAVLDMLYRLGIRTRDLTTIDLFRLGEPDADHTD